MAKRHLEFDSTSTDEDWENSLMSDITCKRIMASKDEVNDLELRVQQKKEVDLEINSCQSPILLKRPMAMILPRLCLRLPSLSDNDHAQLECSEVAVSVGSDEALMRCDTVMDSTSQQYIPSSQSMPSLSSSLSVGTTMAPTNILPFLYLGSQRDALSQNVFTKHGITHVLNVSTSCHSSCLVSDDNFLRIPVNDSNTDRLLPFFHQAFNFLDSVRKSNGCVLVHCLAGISRSPTLVIAFIMHDQHMSMDEAYRFVKSKRPGISPNFNFLGQLMEFETQLNKSIRSNQKPLPGLELEQLEEEQEEDETINSKMEAKRPCYELKIPMAPSRSIKSEPVRPIQSIQSPTATLAKLNFNLQSPSTEEPFTIFLNGGGTSKCFSASPNTEYSSLQEPQEMPMRATSVSLASHKSVPLDCTADAAKTSDTHIDLPIFKNLDVSAVGFSAAQSKVTQRRPSSIAIRCLDTMVSHNKLEVTRSCSSALRIPSPMSSRHVYVTSPTSREASAISLVPPACKTGSDKISTGAFLWHVEQACKSRSLEDILMLSDCEAGTRSKIQDDDDIYQSSGLDLVHQWHREGHHQSSSSMSSIGSHAGSAGHGSLEVF